MPAEGQSSPQGSVLGLTQLSAAPSAVIVRHDYCFFMAIRHR